MSDYYIFRSNPSIDNATPDEPAYMELEDWATRKGFEDWGSGTIAQNRPSGPVEIRAVPYNGYTGLPDDYEDSSVPLMSKRLKQVMQSAGVDNIEFLPITLRNTETGQTYEYFAFNLVGLVSAVDFSKSKIGSHDGDFVGDSQIYDLVIDDSKCRNALMFRLAEKFSTILVHRTVKEAVERSGITSVKFIKPEDFMAL
jgi:hypothetical protein